MTLTNRNEAHALALPAAISPVSIELVIGLVLLALLIGRAGTGAL